MRLPFCLAPILGLAVVATALGDLIPVSLRYDANVRRNADVGVEQHFTSSAALLPPPNPGTLPAINTNLPGSLVDGSDLNLLLTEAANTMILFITSQFGGGFDVFNNPFDPGVMYPVQFDGVFYDDDLGPGEFVNINNIRFENNVDLPFPAPATEMISAAGPNFAAPLGSINNPVRVKLGFTADQLEEYLNGWIKIRISYDRDLVPEPASFALAVFGITAVGLVRRRPRGR